jgi:hypothetical protein
MDKNNGEKVCYDKELMIGMLRDINLMVVSLDRIGSEYGEWEDRPDEAELNQWLADFIFEWKIPEKLSLIRMHLSDQFSYELGDDDMDELERECQDLQYWSRKNRQPDKKTKKDWKEFKKRTEPE